jgi:integrase
MATIRERTWTNAKGVVTKRWQVDFIDQYGKRRHKQFRLKKEADAYLVNTRGEVAAGTYAPESASQTARQAAEAWITRGLAEGLERSSIRQRRHHLVHILDVLGPDTRLSKLTATRLEAAKDALLLKLSRQNARNVVQSMKAVLKQAKSPHLATAELQVKGATRHRKRLEVGTDIPTPDEIKRIVDTASGAGLAMICLAAFAGLRASEIRGLRWSDLDLGQHPSVTVAQRADRWQDIGSPKSPAARRTIPIGTVTLRALRGWKLQQPPGRALVFGTSTDRPDNLANLKRRYLHPVADQLWLRRYGPHSFRHYAISAWLRTCGGDFKQVQVWAGHSSLTMTMDRYGHLLQSKGRQIIADAEAGVFG